MHDIGPTQLEMESFEADHLNEQESGETSFESGPLSETQEVELATELLEVTNEEELEQFLGNLINTVGGAVGRFVRSDTGQALGGILKDAARQTLPLVGRAVGQRVSPGQGGDIGAQVASQAGQLFGLELEGLSEEDREYEVARQFVRFASSAAQQVGAAPPGMPSDENARRAALSAARNYAPGLLPRLRGRSGRLWPHSGKWVRRGRTIVLYAG
jgi:hypothetical protein